MFPSTISTFPIVSPTNRLNSPSHSALHNSVSSVLTQVQTIIGVEGANSVVGSLEYLIKSPASDGGGHVQTAIKGGTGQTTYTKGDLLVATGPSVLSKLAAGLDGQALVYNSSLVTGIGPGTPGGTKIYASASIISVPGTLETSIFSTSVPGSTLGTNNAIRATAFFNRQMYVTSVLFRATYGGGVIASIMVGATSGFTSITGSLSYTLLANNNVSLQRGILQANLGFNKINPGATASIVSLYNMNTASINSSANQTMGLTMVYDAGSGDLDGPIQGVIVEKIT